MFFLLWTLLNVQQFDVVWTHQEVYINVYDDVQSYTLLPEATLYVNGEQVFTNHMTYERGVDRTFLSVLTSVELKTFYIKYRVHFLSYGITDTVTIAFHIVDQTPPEASIDKPIVIEHHQQFDIDQYLKMNDNFDKNHDLQITVLDEHVNYVQVGVYPLEILIRDVSGNTTSVKTTVTVKDFLAPVIIQEKEVVIQPYESFIWQSYFDIKDDLNDTVKINIDDEHVLYDQLGTYQASMCAIDLSDNASCLTFDILIEDSIKPTVILAVKTPTIEVNESINDEIMLSWFLKIEDNFDELNVSTTFFHQINVNLLGVYDVIIEVEDQSFNVTSLSFKVNVVDRIAPNVFLNTPYIHVFETLAPLRSYVFIEDNYYREDALSVNIKTSIDETKIGIYEIEVHVSDPSNNEHHYVFFIEVVDREPPTINIDEAVIITNFEVPNYLIRLKVEDNYDTLDDIYILVQDEDIDFSKPGLHSISIELSDQSNNHIIYDIDVIIVDIIPPSIQVYETALTIELGVKNINLKQNIKAVTDNISEVTMDDVHIIETIDYDKVGRYEVTYQLRDEAGSLVEIVIEVLIQDTIPPVVNATPLVFMYQESIDLYQEIFIEDKDQTQIMMISTQFSPEVGSYLLTYIIYDASGNETVFNREIQIVESGLKAQVEPYATSLLLFVFGTIIAIFMKVISVHKYFDKTKKFKYNNE